MAFKVSSEITDGIAIATLEGELDGLVADTFRQAVNSLASQNPNRLVLDMKKLDFMASAGLRVLAFARQKMGSEVDIYLIGVNDSVRETIVMTGFQYSVIMLDEYNADTVSPATQ